MLEKVDHIGIAVNKLEPALKFYEEVMGLKPLKIETLDEISVRIAFLPLGEILIELLEPTAKGAGRIGQFLEERGPGFHHIAYRVKSIQQAIEALRQRGVALRDEIPRPGGGGSLIAFIEPRETQNVLTELVERP
ncbi:MAG: methylmalonyl-CoA epimerase [Deltaproteobacteria bacterium]|nr:MAG: methylmalonyl-CoA epimerase [Deltaproteobacteria bacterium]